MADQALKVRDRTDRSRQHDDRRQAEVGESNHFADDANMTDAEILLRDWCSDR